MYRITITHHSAALIAIICILMLNVSVLFVPTAHAEVCDDCVDGTASVHGMLAQGNGGNAGNNAGNGGNPPQRPPQINPFFNGLQLSGFGIEQATGPLTIQRMVINILRVTAGSIMALCTAIFIGGAYMFAISAGDEQRKSLGKDLMIGSVIGLAIVIGAKGILDMVYFFVYGI